MARSPKATIACNFEYRSWLPSFNMRRRGVTKSKRYSDVLSPRALAISEMIPQARRTHSSS